MRIKPSFLTSNSIPESGASLPKVGLILVLATGLLWAGRPIERTATAADYFTSPPSLGKIGDNPFPTNPLNERAKGYLIKGKIKSAVFNYGNFIEWGEYSSSTGYSGFPNGMWGNYTYLPNVSFMAGLMGHDYSSKFQWEEVDSKIIGTDTDVTIWASTDAYTEWFKDDNEDGIVDTNYVGVVFDVVDDRGKVGDEVAAIDDINWINQWGLDHDNRRVFVVTPNTTFGVTDPNKPSTFMGLIRPWGLRPALKERTTGYDVYDYGDDDEEWTEDDNYAFYGATLQESWFTRLSPSTNTEWHASNKARTASHNTDYDAGEIFGDTPYVDEDDPYPVLAHSNFSQTWPQTFDEETGNYIPHWPGWWAENYIDTLPGCSGSRKDPDCWETAYGRHVSDTDVYMEFDDRWAHRSNMVNSTGDEYEQTGYPLGIRVRAIAHSYGVAYAEDIMFVTVRVRNESGGYMGDDGIWRQPMIMPDGTTLNRGKGFNYKNISLGFYMDADVVTMNLAGSMAFHTNDDDYMEYFWERFGVNTDTMLISMAMISDYDWNSNGATEIGIVATQLLDSPLATDFVDLDLDGVYDIYPGEPLKMTDWHWFNWYNRPGVVYKESNGNCCAGNQGRPQARNREEIQFKVMAGDTTNLTSDEKDWFFHTPNPDTDLDTELNPHFDSLEGLLQEGDFVGGDEEGLDCVLMFSCGPFDLDVGEEVPFSFCVIFGENPDDLKRNARFAQIMYNSHYQGYTPPTAPTVEAVPDHGQVTITWDNAAEHSTDVVTGYADFEGYKIYKSADGGKTWGGPEDKIYDDQGTLVGWHPVAQFDLSAEDDSQYCIFDNGVCSGEDETRGHAINGPDPLAPWFNLGSDTGLPPTNEQGKYYWVDTDVMDGMEYTYSVTAYDMGVEPPTRTVYNEIMEMDTTSGDTVWVPTGEYKREVVNTASNPNGWSDPTGYASIENSRGTTIHDANFVTVVPGFPSAGNLDSIKVVPNPYIVRSRFNETEYIRKMRFTHLPYNSRVTIFTVTGEKVISMKHTSTTDSNLFWNLRSVNNQEVAPGLYIYVVEWEGKKDIGKFAIVR